MVRPLQSARNLLQEDVQRPEARLAVVAVAEDVVQEAAAVGHKRTPFPRKRTQLEIEKARTISPGLLLFPSNVSLLFSDLQV
jgi:hypothetical protein